MVQNKNSKPVEKQVGRYFEIVLKYISKLFFYSIFSLFIFFLIPSCQQPEIHIDRATRKAIDTLINHKLDSLNPILDSLCVERKESLIKIAIDSIMDKRRKQEERLRNNIR